MVTIYERVASNVDIEEQPHIFVEWAKVLVLAGDVNSAIPIYDEAIQIIRNWDEAARPSKAAFLGEYEQFKGRVRRNQEAPNQAEIK